MLSLTESLSFFEVRPTKAEERRVIAITQMLIRMFLRLRSGPQKSVKKRFNSSKIPVKKRLLFKEKRKMIVGPVRGLRWFQAFFFLKTKNASTANMAMAATAPAISMYLMKSVPFLASSKTLLASFSAAP